MFGEYWLEQASCEFSLHATSHRFVNLLSLFLTRSHSLQKQTHEAWHTAPNCTNGVLVSIHSSIPVTSSRTRSTSLPFGSVSHWYTSSSKVIKPVMLKLLLSRMDMCVDVCVVLAGREWLRVANTTSPFFQRVTDGVMLGGMPRHGSTTFSSNSLIIVTSSVNTVQDKNGHITAESWKPRRLDLHFTGSRKHFVPYIGSTEMQPR